MARATVGQRFGRLTIVSEAGKTQSGVRLVECLCDCGKLKVVRCSNITNGHTKSCGCLQRDTVDRWNRTHGQTKTKGYKTWQEMKTRCLKPSHHSFHNYGGRGITICSEWMSFEKFISDMGQPRLGQQIDRIDNNKGYFKENCRWASPKQNARNRRSSRNILYQGQTKTLAEWAESKGMKLGTLWARLDKGMDMESAMTTPIRIWESQLQAVATCICNEHSEL